MEKKVLIADDSSLIRSKLVDFFTDQGFVIVEAEDGQQGMKKAAENPGINLVLADLNMPFVDGLELTKYIRTLSFGQKIPIFILSTESSTDLKKKGKQAGVTAWILKPFDPHSMLEMLKIMGIN